MTNNLDVPLNDRVRWFAGTLKRIAATAAETAGTFGVMEQWAPIGFSPPLHVHEREASALHVLEGEITVQQGDRTSTIRAGDLAFFPARCRTPFASRATLPTSSSTSLLAGSSSSISTRRTLHSSPPCLPSKPRMSPA